MTSHFQPDRFQPSLFDPDHGHARYPDAPGHNFRDTSIAAAEHMKPKAAAIRLRVLAEIQIRGSTGATCDELEQAFGMSHQTVSARLRELNLSGHVLDSEQRRKTRSGRNAIVWVAREGQR